MRRIQIYLDEAVDDALAAQAARLSTSKAALIREALALRMRGAEGGERGGNLVGWIEEELAGTDSIDDVVYGR